MVVPAFVRRDHRSPVARCPLHMLPDGAAHGRAFVVAPVDDQVNVDILIVHAVRSM